MPSTPVRHGYFIFVPLVVGPEVFGQILAGIAVSGEGGEVDLVIVSEVIGDYHERLLRWVGLVKFSRDRIPDQGAGGTDDYVIIESSGEIHLLSLLRRYSSIHDT